MTPERADRIKLIKEHWALSRDSGLSMYRSGSGAFRCPVLQQKPDAIDSTMPEPTDTVEVLLFEFQHGAFNGVELLRVSCEGVEVEVMQRPSR